MKKNSPSAWMARPATDSCRLLVHGSVEFPSIKMSVEGKTQSSLCSSPFSFLPPTFVGVSLRHRECLNKHLLILIF